MLFMHAWVSDDYKDVQFNTIWSYLLLILVVVVPLLLLLLLVYCFMTILISSSFCRTSNLTVEDSSQSQLLRIISNNREPFRILARGEEIQLRFYSSFTTEQYYEGKGFNLRYFIINNLGKDNKCRILAGRKRQCSGSFVLANKTSLSLQGIGLAE